MLFSLWFQACNEEVQNAVGFEQSSPDNSTAAQSHWGRIIRKFKIQSILNNLRPATQLPRQFRWGSDFPVSMRSRETPVPIPNTMVKTRAAEGTILETIWESRWMPDLKKWGCSSAGRAPALQAGGQEFESLHLHRQRTGKHK